MTMFRMRDPYNIKLLILVLSTLLVKPFPRNFSLIDLSILIIWFYNIIRNLFGENPLLDSQSCIDSTSCFLGYILLKYSERNSKIFFLRSLCVFFGIVASLYLISFAIFHDAIKEAGFTTLYPFRFLYKPLGYMSNAWPTIFLLTLTLLLIGYYIDLKKTWKRFFLALSFVMFFSILLSFSRGAYIALCILALICILLVQTFKKRLIFFSIIISIIAITFILFPQEFITTIQMNKTISQRQSFDSRILASKDAWKIIKTKECFGFGNGSYTYAIDKVSNQDFTHEYTSYAPNIIIQLMIENGIIGTILFFLLFLCILIESYCNKRNKFNLFIIIALICLFIKECTLSIILNFFIASFMFYCILAFIQGDNVVILKCDNISNRIKYILLIISTIFYVYGEKCFLQHRSDEINNLKSIDEYKNGNYKIAAYYMEKTSKYIPYLVNRCLLYMNCYEHKKQSKYLFIAEQSLKIAHNESKGNVFLCFLYSKLLILKGQQSKAYLILKKINKLYPNNLFVLRNLFIITYNSKKTKESSYYLKRILSIAPKFINNNVIKEIKKIDYSFYNNIITSILSQEPSFSDPPQQLATFGYIAYYSGKDNLAKKFLKKSLLELPSLSTPWLLLGNIMENEGKQDEAIILFKRYTLLLNGAFHINHSELLNTEQDFDENEYIWKDYILKFDDWYKSKLFII